MTDTEPPICGAEPPADWVGDCWCTLQPDHTGQHHCEPCTERHGAPGWDDQPTEQSGHVVGHATIGIDVAAAQATESPSIDLRAVPLDVWHALIEVAQWVSRGRSAAFIPDENLGRGYPDAKARRALGALHDAGLLNIQEQQ
jgi:hypothetical protein